MSFGHSDTKQSIMKYYIIAGEASVDLHGSNLIKGLKKSDPEAHFRVWGGDLMQQAGGELVRHYKETAVMGFVEVLMHASKIKKNFDLCKKIWQSTIQMFSF